MFNIDPDYLFKIMLIGNSGTGKTSLLFRFCDDTYSDTYISTIGVDFKIKTLEIDNKIIKLQIWDTAGQERFKTIISSYYRGAHGIIIFFDLSDKKSFDDVESWMIERNKYCNRNICTLLVGTKSDIKNNDDFNINVINELCNKYDTSYIETSSKLNININNVFEKLCFKLMMKYNYNYLKMNEHILSISNSSIIPLILEDNTENKKKCCN